MSFTEVIGNRSLRASVYQTFIPGPAQVQYDLFIGPGQVTVGGIAVSWPGEYVGPFQTLTGLSQVYVNSGNGAIQFQAVTDPAQSTVFPAFSLPIALVHTDAVGRIQQVDDMRLDPPF
jgi:hypothetical protein